jgi:hypothetical protein
MYTLGVVVTFTISFNIAVKVFGQNNNDNFTQDNIEKVASTKVVEKILPEDTKIVLKLQNKNKEVFSKEVTLKEVKNFISGDLTLDKVKQYYSTKDYKLLQEGEKEIIFTKNSNFTPQKYYLGVTDQDFVAIFKCDNEGVLYIEDPNNDISDRVLETLPPQDIEPLKNFEFEYNTKEEALDDLMAFLS